jgi:hypothetical protein
MSSRTIMEMFISPDYSKVLVPCLLSVNSHSSPQFGFSFTYIEFSTIRVNNCVYKILSLEVLSTAKGSRKIWKASCHHQNLIFMNHHHLLRNVPTRDVWHVLKFNLFHKMENIVIPWIISTCSYKRNYIILIWGYMYLFPQFRM